MTVHIRRRYLAEVNVGRVLGGPDEPRMRDFYANLARINALAERMPGFIWRLKGETSDCAMDLRWPGDPSMNVNLSVWKDAESLSKFVFRTVHRNFYARKRDFFEMPTIPMFTLWWVEVGHIPTLEEAKERLDHYQAHGPTDFAFDWTGLSTGSPISERRCADTILFMKG